MKLPLKTLAMLGLLSAMALGGGSPSQAYEGPWCAVLNLGFGSVQERCGMATFEMCRREAQAFGSSSFCRQNSRYLPYWGVGDERRPLRKKKRRVYVR
jgi:hypothetical protein